MGNPSRSNAETTFSPSELRSGEFRVLPDGRLIELAEGKEAPPSSRPTLAPPLHVREVASGTFMRVAMPLDMIVPVRTGVRPAALDHRAAFLLLHVDDCSTLAVIAAAVDLPRLDVYDCFLELRDRKLVELRSVTDGATR